MLDIVVQINNVHAPPPFFSVMAFPEFMKLWQLNPNLIAKVFSV